LFLPWWLTLVYHLEVQRDILVFLSIHKSFKFTVMWLEALVSIIHALCLPVILSLTLPFCLLTRSTSICHCSALSPVSTFLLASVVEVLLSMSGYKCTTLALNPPNLPLLWVAQPICRHFPLETVSLLFVVGLPAIQDNRSGQNNYQHHVLVDCNLNTLCLYVCLLVLRDLVLLLHVLVQRTQQHLVLPFLEI
jgi:hypothetical protein